MTESTNWPDPEQLRATEQQDRAARRQLFSAYVDGELPKDVSDALEQRVEADPAFEEAYRSYEAMITSLRDLPSQGADEAFLSDVQDSLRRRSGGRFFGAGSIGGSEISSFTSQTRVHELAAAAMLAVMLGAYLSFGPSTGDLTTSDSPRLDVPPQSAERHQ
jgi:anti-sigma factor RsiW